MLLNVTAHNVSIQNIKVSKHERHIMYSVTKHTYVLLSLHNVHFTFCNGIRFVTLNVMWRLCFENFMFWNFYVVYSHVLYHYVMWHLRYVALRYVATSTYLVYGMDDAPTGLSAPLLLQPGALCRHLPAPQQAGVAVQPHLRPQQELRKSTARWLS